MFKAESSTAVLPEPVNKNEKNNPEDLKKINFQDIFSIYETEKEEAKKEKDAIDLIRKSSLEDFFNFVITDLPHNPRRHNLSKNIVKAILEKGLSGYDATKNTLLLSELNTGIQLQGDFQRKNPKEESITDKAFQSMMELYKDYPEACDQFWNFLGQNGQTIRPDILVGGIANIAWNPDFEKSFQSGTLHNFNYLYAFHSKQYDEVIKNALDFNNPENFSRTGKFLEFMKKLHALSGDLSFSENKQSGISSILEEVVAKGKGSYLLNLRACELLEKMDKWEKSSEWKKSLTIFEDHNDTPFDIAPDVVGYHDGDMLYTVNRKTGGDMLPLEVSKIMLVDKGEKENDAQLFNDFIYISQPAIRKFIRKDIGINLSGVSLREQAYFLQVLKNKSSSEIEPLKNFTKTYGKNGFRAFLSMEYDRTLGDKILQIGENLEKEDAQKVFAKVSELVDLAEKENEELAGMFFENKKGTDMSGAKFELLKKAQEIIVKFSDKLKEGGDNQREIAELLDNLEKTKTEIVFFKSVFKQVIKENPEMKLGDFRNLDMQFSTKDVSENDMQKMRLNIEKNYPDLEERGIALQGLEGGLKNKNTVFDILQYKGELVSFLRFDRHYKNGVSYFGSFNVDPDFQKVAIGEAVMKECLQAELTFNAETLEAHTFPDKKITSKYIEEAGFIIEDIELNYLGTSKALFKIRRDDTVNWKYKYRGEFDEKDRKELEALVESGVEAEPGKSFIKIEAEKIKDAVTLEKIKTFMQKHNLVITRYFPDDKNNPKYYTLAFEAKIPESEPAAYIV